MNSYKAKLRTKYVAGLKTPEQYWDYYFNGIESRRSMKNAQSKYYKNGVNQTFRLLLGHIKKAEGEILGNFTPDNEFRFTGLNNILLVQKRELFECYSGVFRQVLEYLLSVSSVNNDDNGVAKEKLFVFMSLFRYAIDRNIENDTHFRIFGSVVNDYFRAHPDKLTQDFCLAILRSILSGLQNGKLRTMDLYGAPLIKIFDLTSDKKEDKVMLSAYLTLAHENVGVYQDLGLENISKFETLSKHLLPDLHAIQWLNFLSFVYGPNLFGGDVDTKERILSFCMQKNHFGSMDFYIGGIDVSDIPSDKRIDYMIDLDRKQIEQTADFTVELFYSKDSASLSPKDVIAEAKKLRKKNVADLFVGEDMTKERFEGRIDRIIVTFGELDKSLKRHQK